MDFPEEDDDIIRSSCSQMFFKIGVTTQFKSKERQIESS